MSGPAEQVAETVRQGDRIRYVSTLYAPAEIRGDLLALYAFHLEITRIADLVSEPMPGEVRLQWWRDVLNGDTGTETAGHPVATELGRVIARHSLPVTSLLNMIEARSFDLYADPMPSRTDLEGYCGETAGALLQLASIICSGDNPADHANAAGHGGCALEIIRIVGRQHVHRRRGQCLVPQDLLASAGLSANEFAGSQSSAGHQAAISAMLALAREHYREFANHAAKLPRHTLPAFLPLATVPGRAGRLQKAGLGLFERPIAGAPIREQAVMALRSAHGW